MPRKAIKVVNSELKQRTFMERTATEFWQLLVFGDFLSRLRYENGIWVLVGFVRRHLLNVELVIPFSRHEHGLRCREWFGTKNFWLGVISPPPPAAPGEWFYPVLVKKNYPPRSGGNFFITPGRFEVRDIKTLGRAVRSPPITPSAHVCPLPPQSCPLGKVMLKSPDIRFNFEHFSIKDEKQRWEPLLMRFLSYFKNRCESARSVGN
jgi:hypothetical protein